MKYLGRGVDFFCFLGRTVHGAVVWESALSVPPYRVALPIHIIVARAYDIAPPPNKYIASTTPPSLIVFLVCEPLFPFFH